MFFGNEFLTRSATIWPVIGRDVYGGYEFGAPVFTGNNSIFYTETNEIFRNADGQELVAKAKVWTKESIASSWVRGSYIKFDGDFTADDDPIAVGAYEIDAIRIKPAKMFGSEDAYQVFVR